MYEMNEETLKIRILPEWNVKVASGIESNIDSNIRILPEWNVKSKDIWELIFSYILESYQSGM